MGYIPCVIIDELVDKMVMDLDNLLVQYLAELVISSTVFQWIILVIMHLSLFSPRVVVAGIPWGLDIQIILSQPLGIPQKILTHGQGIRPLKKFMKKLSTNFNAHLGDFQHVCDSWVGN